MAAETEVIKVQVNGVELAITNIKEARKALKDLQSQALTGNKEAARSFAELKDKLEDLRDETETLKGTGIEKLNASFGLLRDGFQNFDGDKISTAFNGIGAAMKAIPIFLLIEGIRLLIENFDKVVALFDSSADEIKKNERALNDLTLAIDRNKNKTDELILIKEAELKILERENGSLGNIITKIKEINNLKQDQIAGELAKTDKAINNIVEKLKAAQKDLESRTVTESLLQFLGFDSGTTAEEVKAIEDELSKALTQRGAIYNQGVALELQTADQIAEVKKRAADKAKAEREKLNRDLLQAFNSDDPELSIEQQRLAEKDRLNQEYLARKEKVYQDEIKATGDRVRAETELEKQAAAEKLRIEQAKEDRKRQLSSQALNTLQGLSNVFFANQLKAVSGNADAELRVKKKQFEVEKAFRLANVAIDTASAILKTTAQLGLPAATPFNIAAATLGSIQAGIIAAAQFDPGQTSASVSANSATGVSSPDVSVNPPQTFTQPQSTAIQRNENNKPIKVVVLQQDIRDAISEATKVELQASY